MLRIFGTIRSRAARSIWLAEELGIPYELVPVDYALKQTRTAEFLAINPSGHVPAIDDDGLILSESMAINLYLVRKHADSPAAPAGLVEEGRCLNWTLFAVTELESPALAVLMHGRAMPVERRDPEKFARACGALRPPLGVLELALTGASPMSLTRGVAQDWLLGNRFTVADLNLAAVLEWTGPAPTLLDEFPAAKAWLARCLARPSHDRLKAMRRPVA